MVFQCPDGIGGGLLGRVEEGQITQQHHVPLVLYTKGIHRGGVALLGNGQHPEALIIEFIYCMQIFAAQGICQRLYPAVLLGVGADGKHFLYCTLRHHLGLASLILHHSGQTAAGEVEGNLIHLHIVLGQIEQPGVGSFFLGLVDDGKVHQVLVAGLEVAVQVGVAQHASVVFAVDVQVIFQHHLILCQGASLVGAEDINGTKVLDGVQVFHDGLLFAHGDSALGKAGSHDHGQHLRGQAHGDGDTEQKRFQPVALGDAIDEEHQRHHDHHKADQHPRNGIDTLGETGLHRLPSHGRSHGAEEGLVTHADRHGGGAAGDHIAAHKSDVGVVGHAVLRGTDQRGLFNGFAFAGQAGLTDKQVLGLQNADVCRDHIACREVHDVSHHQIVHGDLPLFLLSPGDHAGGGDHGQQLFRRVAAAGFLHKPQGAGDEHHGQDDHDRQRVKILRRTAQQGKIREHHIRHGGHQRQTEQNGGKGIDERPRQTLDERLFLFVGHLVAAVLGTAVGHRSVIQPPEGGVEILQHLAFRIGGGELDAAVLLVPEHRLCCRLPDGHAVFFFLIHGSYLLPTPLEYKNRKEDPMAKALRFPCD